MLKINGLEFQETRCKYEAGVLRIEFDIQNITLQELEEYFSLNEGTIIEQYDNDTIINKWYYKEFHSIGYEKKTDGWHINLSLWADIITPDNLTEIYDSLQEKEDALLELASIIDSSDTQAHSIDNTIQELKEEIAAIRTKVNEQLASFQQAIYDMSNEQIKLTARISLLESNIGGGNSDG